MAKQYPSDEPTPAGEPRTVVTRPPAEGNARTYPGPERRRALPWWLLLVPLLLIPLFLLRRDDNDEEQQRVVQSTPAATATPLAVASPDVVTDAATAGAVAGGAAGMASMDGATGQASSAVQEPTATQGEDIKIYKGRDIAVAPKAGASAKGEPLSDVVDFAAVNDRSALVGRKVKLTNVNVAQAFNQRAFLVGAGEGQRMLVLLDPKLAPTAGKKFTVRQGQPVTLMGYLKPLPAAQQLQSQYKLGASDYAGLQQEQVYLHATVAQAKQQ